MSSMENHSALLSVDDGDSNNNDPISDKIQNIVDIQSDKNTNLNSDDKANKDDSVVKQHSSEKTDKKDLENGDHFTGVDISSEDGLNPYSNGEESSFHYKHILYNFWRKLIWVPPFVSALLVPITVVGLYSWALLNQQIDPFLPYISEVGTLPPQAGFFSMFLDCFALLSALTFFIRYKMLKYQIRQIGYQKKNFLQILHGINWLSVGSGYAHCGLVIFIGNFRAQEWQIAHLLAAICAFFTFAVYSGASTYVTGYVHKSGQESTPTTMRVSVFLQVLSMTGAFSTLLLSFWFVGKDVYDPDSAFQWHSSNIGDTIHDVSAIFQWTIFHSMGLYQLCLSRRMYHFKSWDKVKLTQ